MGWVIKNGGLPTEATYPYSSGMGDTGVCDDSLNTVAGGTISDWAYTQPTCQPGSAACVEDSEAMANGVKSGGIAIAIDASGFFSYTGGVMTNDSCSSDPSMLDHAIQVVGWDTTDSANPYWIVRNSWAEVWGEAGLVRFAMGDNTCGVANFAVVAIV